jgi:hypothetical protein
MSTITVELSKERLQELEQLARKFGISAEELVRLSVEDLLTRPDEQFQKSARYVLKKNSELYKRLSA